MVTKIVILIALCIISGIFCWFLVKYTHKKYFYNLRVNTADAWFTILPIFNSLYFISLLFFIIIMSITKIIKIDPNKFFKIK